MCFTLRCLKLEFNVGPQCVYTYRHTFTTTEHVYRETVEPIVNLKQRLITELTVC